MDIEDEELRLTQNHDQGDGASGGEGRSNQAERNRVSAESYKESSGDQQIKGIER
ncbi:hypothetical protein YC2023_101349 [Brassica napus]